MTTDIIIVGQGLAGSILGYMLQQRGYSLCIYDDGLQQASAVAAGLFNPITGKRLVKTWLAEDIFPFLEKFYVSTGLQLNEEIFFPLDLYRPFGSIKELNDWSAKNQEELNDLFVKNIRTSPFMPELIRNNFGGMFLRGSGYVNTARLIACLGEKFKEKNFHISEKFDENLLVTYPDHIEYKGIKANRIIYCNGISSSQSRFFKNLPFKPVKGEILTVKLDVDIPFIINKGIFIIPERETIYKAGATYDRDDPWSGISKSGKDYILYKIKQLLNVEVTVINHVSGIRPATDDRRPFIGFHPRQTKLGIFNGFGSKGVSLIPYLADQFIRHIETQAHIDKEADILRYFN